MLYSQQWGYWGTLSLSRVSNHAGQRLPGPLMALAALLLLLDTSASTALLLATSWSPLVASLDNLVLSLPDTSRMTGLRWRGGISPMFCQ